MADGPVYEVRTFIGTVNVLNLLSLSIIKSKRRI